MKEIDEEQQLITDSEDLKASLCPSYRLLVWLILGMGSTLSFMGLSSQPAVFTCRRLALDHASRPSDPSTHDLNLTGHPAASRESRGTGNLRETGLGQWYPSYKLVR
ncbi:hypothetical protein ACOMHN_044775 [Nucella lapillus]